VSETAESPTVSMEGGEATFKLKVKVFFKSYSKKGGEKDDPTTSQADDADHAASQTDDADYAASQTDDADYAASQTDDADYAASQTVRICIQRKSFGNFPSNFCVKLSGGILPAQGKSSGNVS
jgi:hypothetical protein